MDSEIPVYKLRYVVVCCPMLCIVMLSLCHVVLYMYVTLCCAMFGYVGPCIKIMFCYVVPCCAMLCF